MNTEFTAYKAKVVELQSFIEYSGSSVVNTLLDKKAGIKLQSFDTGLELSEHNILYNTVERVIDRTAEIIVEKVRLVERLTY